MLKLYSNIKALRLALKMTQDELAKKVGYKGKSMIAKIENGEVDLSQTKIMAFAEALGTSASELMGWEDDTTAVSLDNLSDTQKQIIDVTNRLNDEGQAKVREYASDLDESGKYNKKPRTSSKLA